MLQDILGSFSILLPHLHPEPFKDSLHCMDYDTDQDTKSLVLQLSLVNINKQGLTSDKILKEGSA